MGKIILGIDEAGRGCVIGPMIICTAYCDEADIEELKMLGVKDSKDLSREKRDFIFSHLDGRMEYEITTVTPMQIDKGNLNTITFDNSVAMLKKYKPDVAYLDAPVPRHNLEAYNERLRKEVGDDKVDIHAENKADSKYPIVSTASIIAKVTRDGIIDQINKKYPVGCGYPHDAVTIKFLNDYFKKNRRFPVKIVRTKWYTCQEIVDKYRNPKLL